MIATLSLVPGRTASALALPIPYFDKLAHAVMHGLFALLLCWALQYHLRHKAWLVFAFVFCVLYGIIMEFAQFKFVAVDRSFSWGDIAANTVGVLAAIVFLGITHKRNRPS